MRGLKGVNCARNQSLTRFVETPFTQEGAFLLSIVLQAYLLKNHPFGIVTGVCREENGAKIDDENRI